MASYAVDWGRTASTTLSLGNAIADATRPRRQRWYDLTFGSQGTVGDNPFLYTLQRCTTAGTATSVVPQPLDPADAATEFDAGENHTIEPTYTAAAILLNIAMNQRATYRWQTLPEFALVVPATASNGIGIQTTISAAVAIQAQAHIQEQ